MKIAILGATSQIARDLIVSFSAVENIQLHLFARRPDEVRGWLEVVGLSNRYEINDFTGFSSQTFFDTVINFVGVGNPAQAVAMGSAIFDITSRFDEMVLNYLQVHTTCCYLFLSSGAVYGSSFDEPAHLNRPAMVAINNLAPHEWYGVAKLHAESRHRAHPELAIIDIRIFNYFSRSQDISARFLISDILRAIRDQTVLKISPDYIVRDFLHPADFHRLITALITAPAINAVVDCYTLAPLDKKTLLKAMQEKFGLQYEEDASNSGVNATGVKPFYFSLNKRAADFGYRPGLTSLEGVLLEAEAVLSQKYVSLSK